jgi:hypothetical protein
MTLPTLAAGLLVVYCPAVCLAVPVVITSYRKVQFTLPVEHIHHCLLKEALWAQAAAADWLEHLPWVLSSIKAAAKEASNKSPADLLCSSQLVCQSSSSQKFQFTVPGGWVSAQAHPASHCGATDAIPERVPDACAMSASSWSAMSPLCWRWRLCMPALTLCVSSLLVFCACRLATRLRWSPLLA